jgi:hypothetical protein
MPFFSPLMMTVEEVYLKNYIYREPINILEELNDQIHETLATVIPNMLRLARENLIKRARLFLQMKGAFPDLDSIHLFTCLWRNYPIFGYFKSSCHF